MSNSKTVRELFVILEGGLPLVHVGTGHVEVDDALLGGLISAINNVGMSLGLSEGGELDTIAFKNYFMVYDKTNQDLIVLLTTPETPEFYAKSRVELKAIGEELKSKGYLRIDSERTSEKIAELTSIIASRGRTIFSEQNDVFIWDEAHSFQLVKGINERWNGDSLFRNYLLLSPLAKALTIEHKDMVRLCDLLIEMKRPSELISEPNLNVKEPRIIMDTIKFLHTMGLVQCYGSSIFK
jgi:hypothetical protein